MMCRDGGRLFQTCGPQTVNERRPSSVRVHRVTAAHCTSRSRAQRSSLWVRHAEGNEVGDVRRTPLRYDLTWCTKTASASFVASSCPVQGPPLRLEALHVGAVIGECLRWKEMFNRHNEQLEAMPTVAWSQNIAWLHCRIMCNWT